MAARNINKIFVNNLPWTIGHQELRHHFAQFGFVTSANVIFDKSTGMSRGYGFVQFANRQGVESATSKSLQFLEGNMVNIRDANSK